VILPLPKDEVYHSLLGNEDAGWEPLGATTELALINPAIIPESVGEDPPASSTCCPGLTV